ncbi:MAG TPA: NAD(P)H-hydrate dehydratase [Vicinamibacterales bacterium]|nr:NAD(P)H-hydrate dehydratase [Vicinamibacterales bacterium]
MRVLNAAQMRDADRQTVDDIGIPSMVLMENAGRQVVAALEAAHDDLADKYVAVLCGPGNNGGDGFVVARTLHQRGVEVSVFVIGTITSIKGDARLNVEILGRLGLTVVEIADEQAWDLHFSEISQCDLIVDAIFGTGLKSPLAGMMETVAADVNASGLPVIAIDLPSGLSADHAEPIGECIRATMTVTLAAPKLPLVLPPGESQAGNIVVADIGIPPEVIDNLAGPRLELLTREAMREIIQPRESDSHKGDYGHVLVVAGSRGKTGAAHLAAVGALRSGAGLVSVATPKSSQPIVAAMGSEYMTLALDETPDGSVAASSLQAILDSEQDVIAAGPGLGTGPDVTAFVQDLVQKSETPLVLDADALNALASNPDLLQAGPGSRPIIITPHPGEMSRLANTSVDEVQASRLDVARDFAVQHQIYVVLKGYRTLIATPDGKVFINPLGNPGMATGGTGDVLCGVLAAWLAQLLDAEAACKIAVYLHALAGDLTEADEGEVAMTAGDLAAHLGDAVLELTARRRVKPSNGES